jgi:hypothetical protein
VFVINNRLARSILPGSIKVPLPAVPMLSTYVFNNDFAMLFSYLYYDNAIANATAKLVFDAPEAPLIPVAPAAPVAPLAPA